MGTYSARHLILLPGLLSLARLPLAAVFPSVVGRPALALAVLAAAGVSDVLDGWIARRSGQVTPTGAVIDAVSDKIFVLTVAVTLVVRQYLSPTDVLLLSTRELGELPLVVWIAASRRGRRLRVENASANVPGKLATTLQFAAATTVLLRWQYVREMVAATAVAGVVAATVYWARSVRAARDRPGARSG